MSQNQIKASIKLQAKIRKAHLTVRQMVFADLLAIGYEPKDAYQISGLFDNIITPPENWKRMRALMETNEAFNNYVPAFKANSEPILKPTKKIKKVEESEVQEELVKSVSSHNITDDEMAELLSKDNQLKELLWKLKYGNLDDQTELKVRQMIADITNAKKEQSQIEERHTNYYLPLTCFNCSLYMNAEKSKNKHKRD